MTLEGAETFSMSLFPYLPHPQNSIVVSMNQYLSIRAKGKSADHAAISLKRAETLAALHVP
jgi:hypothetical protein